MSDEYIKTVIAQNPGEQTKMTMTDTRTGVTVSRYGRSAVRMYGHLELALREVHAMSCKSCGVRIAHPEHETNEYCLHLENVRVPTAAETMSRLDVRPGDPVLIDAYFCDVDCLKAWAGKRE